MIKLQPHQLQTACRVGKNGLRLLIYMISHSAVAWPSGLGVKGELKQRCF